MDKQTWTVAVFLRTAREPCHDWQASVSAKWDGRSRAIFACSLVVGGGHPGNVEGCSHGESSITCFPFRCPTVHNLCRTSQPQIAQRGIAYGGTTYRCRPFHEMAKRRIAMVFTVGKSTNADSNPKLEVHLRTTEIGTAVRKESSGRSTIAPTQEPSIPERNVPRFEWHVRRRGRKAWSEGVARSWLTWVVAKNRKARTVRLCLKLNELTASSCSAGAAALSLSLQACDRRKHQRV